MNQLLPLEPAALEVEGSKQTSNPAGAIRAILGRRDAAKFYNKELGWPLVIFNCINWEGLATTMENKGDPFRLWLSKQVNGFCGTQVMVSHWDSSRDDLCPNCGTQETAAHLMRCAGHSRTLLLKDQVKQLENWLIYNNTSPEITFWIPKYLLLRNVRALSSFTNLPDSLKKFAAEQDAIGWREFM